MSDSFVPLAQIGTLRLTGVDTDSFLQGQLSNDIGRLTAGHAQLTSWSSAKGRVLAIFTAIRSGDAVLLQTAPFFCAKSMDLPIILVSA